MRSLLLLFFSMLFVRGAYSQAGTLDRSYGNNGVSAGVPGNVRPNSMVVQPDGKIVLLGRIPDPEQYQIVGIVRYKADGSIDRSFSGDGVRRDREVNVGIFGADVAVQSDGKILMAAVEGGCCGGTNLVIKRYNKDGTLDVTFNASTPVDFSAGSAPSLAVQSDGKMVVTGNLVTDGTDGSVFVDEFNTDGTLYRNFSISTNASADIYPSVSAYNDGGYVVSYTAADSTAVVYSSRFGEKVLNSGNGNAFSNVQHAILNNGKVAVSGNTDADGRVLLLKANGTADSSFGTNGYVAVPGLGIRQIVAQPNGKLIVEGFRSGTGDGFLRLNANGTIDHSFGVNGIVRTVEPLYKLVVYGNRVFGLGSGSVYAYLLSTEPRFVKVNLYGNSDPYLNREWNNWNNLRNRHFNNFYYSDSTITSISAIMSNRNGVNDNSAGYGGGMAPAGVLRHSSYAIGARTITFSGLNTARRYSFELYSSRNAFPTDSTIFSINGVMKKIGTYQNHTKKAVFTNLSPNAEGQIVLTISSTKTYNYLNGFILTERFVKTASAMDNSLTMLQKQEPTVVEQLQVTAYPNPARQAFTLQLKSGSKAPVQVRILDAAGRVVEQKQTLPSNTTLFIGEGYKPGVYYVETLQGGRRNLVKLVKQ